jgi:hypothetical protein
VVRRATPVRTCVGCRKRAPASELLRVVAVTGDTEGDVDRVGASDGNHTSAARRVEIVPDPARRCPGRGAHLHFDPACLELAARRRAFGRALRVVGITETGAVAAYLNDRTMHNGTIA